jgi:hypothetical protein
VIRKIYLRQYFDFSLRLEKEKKNRTIKRNEKKMWKSDKKIDKTHRYFGHTYLVKELKNKKTFG